MMAQLIQTTRKSCAVRRSLSSDARCVDAWPCRPLTSVVPTVLQR